MLSLTISVAYFACCQVFCIFFTIVNGHSVPLDRVRGWNYLNLHCRDNENRPVGWWYIYKPPSDIAPYLELGRNFTYITSRNAGRWQPSSKYITANSMLQHTLSPIYRPTYTDYLAVAVYEPRSTSQARGVLLADEVGGVWIGHTVPGLIDMRDDRPTFPDSERANGHLLMCLSIDLLAINAIASALQVAAPTFTYVKVPNRMRELLPTWAFENNTNSNEKHTKKVNFLTNSEFLTVEMLAGPPDNEGSLYEEFAASKQLVLDVYSPTDGEYLSSVCAKNFSVRNIETISLKMKESVQYVSYLNDRTRFAVSTAASWQKMKSSPPQYWTCVSNLDKEDTIGKGGLITCVDNYPIWLTFDNFKVKEPECY